MAILPESSPRRLLLVSCPRTASNLLLKIINLKEQSNVLANEQGGYFFFPAFTEGTKRGRLAKRADEWTTEDRTEVQSAFQQCLNTLEDWSDRAIKEDKILFAKEHSFWFWNPTSLTANKSSNGTADAQKYEPLFRLQFPNSYGPCNTFSSTNETVLPDEYLRTWRLAFLIRHPALMCPSLYRAMQKLVAFGVLKKEELPGVMKTNMSLHWPRMLYDWAVEQGIPGAEPLILDAHDVIHNPQAVVQFCEKAGLDPSKMIFEWKSKEIPTHQSATSQNGSDQNVTGMDESTKKAAASVMLSSLIDSSGVLKDKAPVTVDIAVESAKWKEEFGEEGGRLVEDGVLAAMSDYKYLKERRVRVESA
ncbi:hypothetical protein FE257_000642 [Aspergillus nanangensis]|uniref:Uncharacterized protein n=1 Tax=Aspergillus nanangensis TaxID=2582783 RepID=A0AAD4GQ69_ASPNN|nr:hypothetical protein FE257_000642 [Aspergillus nanangensis]